MIELILGGARSGKSRHAVLGAQASNLPVTFIATAEARDDEMAERIRRHRLERPPAWTTLEEPFALARTLEGCAREKGAVIVDCLTLWLSNHLCRGDEAAYLAERQALLELVPGYPNPLFLVSNEIGLGVVPLESLTRRFVDEAGWLHQALGRTVPRVTLLVAGVPVRVKDVTP